MVHHELNPNEIIPYPELVHLLLLRKHNRVHMRVNNLYQMPMQLLRLSLVEHVLIGGQKIHCRVVFYQQILSNSAVA